MMKWSDAVCQKLHDLRLIWWYRIFNLDIFISICHYSDKVPWGRDFKITWKFGLFKQWNKLFRFFSRPSLQTFDQLNNQTVFRQIRTVNLNYWNMNMEYNNNDNQDLSYKKKWSFGFDCIKLKLDTRRSSFNAKIVSKGFGSQGLCPWILVATAITSLLTPRPNSKA